MNARADITGNPVDETMRQPFAGVRILDFTRFLAGPFGSYQLALQGADVIKVEPPDGDDLRESLIGGEWSARRMAPAFLAVNANKRSIALNLRHPDAVAVVKRLVRDMDVVWENFRPGVMARLGLGYEVLAEINPRLIYCAVSGFGSSGPESGKAAFDGKLQAMSGIMSLTGEPEGGPMRAGFPACDLITGMTAAFAVSSALYQRTHTGRGQFVDVAMLDATLTFLSQHVTEYFVAGHRQRQYGNLSVSRKATANRFRTRDGYLVLAVLTEKQYVALMRAIGRADTLDDPRFQDWAARSANEPALRQIIEGVFATDSAQAWEARLTAADVPCAGVLAVDEVVGHPQLAHRGFLHHLESDDGTITVVGSGFRLAHGHGGAHQPPARLGQHAGEILAEFGYSPAAIATLRASGGLAGPMYPQELPE